MIFIKRIIAEKNHTHLIFEHFYWTAVLLFYHKLCFLYMPIPDLSIKVKTTAVYRSNSERLAICQSFAQYLLCYNSSISLKECLWLRVLRLKYSLVKCLNGWISAQKPHRRTCSWADLCDLSDSPHYTTAFKNDPIFIFPVHLNTSHCPVGSALGRVWLLGAYFPSYNLLDF